MIKNIALLAIAGVFIGNITSAQAEYKIKFQQEKLPLKGVWTADSYRYENWQDVDGLFNCGEWSPSADTKYQNTIFTQTATCSQKQERDVYVVEKFSVTEEERERFYETEEQIISRNKTQSVEGTKPPEYINQCFYDSSNYWEWYFDDSGGCSYSCTGIYAKSSPNRITVRSLGGYFSDTKYVKSSNKSTRRSPNWMTELPNPVMINGGYHRIYRGAEKYSNVNYSNERRKWEVCIEPY